MGRLWTRVERVLGGGPGGESTGSK
ncbi:uncharacterized protein G2W53_021328 [Senna tora]|uniref:Uncharacterized protein n=1 Tax=Senna tora TaxID=362788 RepID=A0A834TSN0_9FABA|nr:uncharacterized protein G2W53_021328 [Senna tora]